MIQFHPDFPAVRSPRYFQVMRQTEAGWNALELHRQLVRRAYRILRSPEAAEDAVQDAYVRYLSHQDNEIQSPVAWLNITVRNIVCDHLRRTDAERRYLHRRASSMPIDDSEAACRQSVRRTLRRAYTEVSSPNLADIQADPLLVARVDLFEQAIHDGQAEPLLDHLRVSASACAQTGTCLVRSHWLPFNQFGHLVFRLFLGPVGLCSTGITPVLVGNSFSA